MKVAVYFNLHKNIFSLQSRDKETYGRVIEHTEHVILKNVNFVVRPKGREKVLKEKTKNVHAFVVGEVIQGLPSGKTHSIEVPVVYNPYQGPSFVERATKEPVYEADYAVLRLGPLDKKPLTSIYNSTYN
jgi:hypothetical protein